MSARDGNYYVEQMKHALGGDPDSRIDPLDVLNDAITFVTWAHDWKFRKRPPLDILFTPAQSYVLLPDDFGELMDGGVVTKNSAISSVVVTSLQEIAWRRGSPNAVAYDRVWRVALSWAGQDNDQTNLPGIPQLEIEPTPTSSNPTGDLTIVYRAGAITMDDLNEFPNFPPQLSRLVAMTCRLFIQGLEEEQVQADPLWQAEFKSMIDGDGRQSPEVGQIRGGAIHQVLGDYPLRRFNTIGNGTRGS